MYYVANQFYTVLIPWPYAGVPAGLSGLIVTRLFVLCVGLPIDNLTFPQEIQCFKYLVFCGRLVYANVADIFQQSKVDVFRTILFVVLH